MHHWGLFEMLVVFHVKPHAEKQRLQSADQRENESHRIHARNNAAGCPQIDESDPQRNTGRQ